jgi:hypothetical protein
MVPTVPVSLTLLTPHDVTSLTYGGGVRSVLKDRPTVTPRSSKR